jgi:hypothetical protein
MEQEFTLNTQDLSLRQRDSSSSSGNSSRIVTSDTFPIGKLKMMNNNEKYFRAACAEELRKNYPPNVTTHLDLSYCKNLVPDGMIFNSCTI